MGTMTEQARKLIEAKLGRPVVEVSPHETDWNAKRLLDLSKDLKRTMDKVDHWIGEVMKGHSARGFVSIDSVSLENALRQVKALAEDAKDLQTQIEVMLENEKHGA